MKHGSLFSGIGGFDLAAEWMGWDNVFHCEWNPFGQRILKHYWPNAASYSDIKQFDATIYRGQLDIITGGFPCQPFSLAGKRKGTDDDRYLWPEMLRIIREVQPTWVVGENVFGLVNWDGGMVFEQVCADLEAEGYEVQPVILPACSKDAPHRRERIWFIAYANSNGQLGGDSQYEKYAGERREYAQCDTVSGNDNGFTSNAHDNGPHRTENRQGYKEGNGDNEAGQKSAIQSEGRGGEANVTDALSKRRIEMELQRENAKREMFGSDGQKGQNNGWDKWPTQSPVCSGDDGLPAGLDGITFSKWRNESIKGYGNAIVPQVAYEIFKVIEQMNAA